MLGQLSQRLNTAMTGEPGASDSYNDRTKLSQSGVMSKIQTPDTATMTSTSIAVSTEPNQKSPEITTAARFLAALLLPSGTTTEVETVLRNRLACILASRFRGHWFEDQPERGSGFRSLSFRPGLGGLDNVVIPALIEAGVTSVAAAVTTETILWIDPGTVSCRSNGGSIRALYGSLSLPAASPQRNYSRMTGEKPRLSPKASEFTPRSRSQSPPTARTKRPQFITVPSPPLHRRQPQATSAATTMLAPPGLMVHKSGLSTPSTPPGLKIPAFLFNGVRA